MAVSGINNMSTSFEQLSSMKQINKAADNAAGLSIVEKMNSQVNGYDTGADNAAAGKDLLNVADGALGTIADSLQRIRELSIQAGNVTYTDDDKVALQDEVGALLKDIQAEFGLTYIFIAHDLGVVRHISDRVGVMYLGKLVELADSEELYTNPLHPYTKALLSSVPIPDPDIKREKIELTGDIPSASNPPSGCPFHTRCAYAMEACKSVIPVYQELERGHYAACHLYDDAISNDNKMIK